MIWGIFFKWVEWFFGDQNELVLKRRSMKQLWAPKSKGMVVELAFWGDEYES